MDEKSTPKPGMNNGNAADTWETIGALSRELVMLRARCSNLRHWCRLMLEDPETAGVLDPTAAALVAVPPAISEVDGQMVVSLLVRGGNVPPTHPLATTSSNPEDLRGAIARQTAEWEKLREACFALLDHVDPDGVPSEEELHDLLHGPRGKPLRELIAELEREVVE